jgi:hypothetical protein
MITMRHKSFESMELHFDFLTVRFEKIPGSSDAAAWVRITRLVLAESNPLRRISEDES